PTAADRNTDTAEPAAADADLHLAAPENTAPQPALAAADQPPAAPENTATEPTRTASGQRPPAVQLRQARLSYGDRTLWQGLDLEVAPGEFIAILGPNGSGKTSLLRMLLGQLAPSAGTVEVAGIPARLGNPHIGYVPQQKTIDSGVPLRGVDLV